MGEIQLDYSELEKKIDDWMPKMINIGIPRYSFIFHCNCAYVDAAVETGCFFSSSESLERHLVFALNYLTHLAYKYLPEEDVFNYEVNNLAYNYVYELLLEAIIYAELCDIFPKAYHNKASFFQKGNRIIVNEQELSRDSMQQFEYYLLRKPLHYVLQYGCGRTAKQDMSMRQMAIVNLFERYWGENVQNNDYQPYTAVEGAGFRAFLLSAAARRYILLYDSDYKVRQLRWTELLICFSSKGASQLRDMIPTDNDEYFQQAVEDCIYKPLGSGDYPKANLADAPIIRTKDGCMFVNPFILLFNNSVDTQFLNYLRRHDHNRFLILKDRIKERCIPDVEGWLGQKISGLRKKSNFEVKIPNTKNKRELDLLVCDSKGIALYIEFKHFYLPESYSEKRNLDREIKKAQRKMKEQLLAIHESGDEVIRLMGLDHRLNKLYGMIASYLYTGTDVGFDDECPIISLSTLKEAINNSEQISEIYDFCRTIEKRYTDVPLVKKKVVRPYANMNFELTKKVFAPDFEEKANKRIWNQVIKAMDSGIALKSVRYIDLCLSEIDATEGKMDETINDTFHKLGDGEKSLKGRNNPNTSKKKQRRRKKQTT